MKVLLQILFAFPYIAFSIDESIFDNQISQCACAVKPYMCNPYCDCDPFCTNDQKKEFNFYLPESFSDSKISCDQKKSISKVNLNSIKEELPNCYSIEGKENGKKIDNYDPSDFGIENFNEAVDSIKFSNKFVYNTTYQIGQNIIGYGSMRYKQMFSLPISVGSSASNAFIPIKFGITYPKYDCRVVFPTPHLFISDNSLIESVYDPSGMTKVVTFELFEAVLDNVNFADHSFLNLQYIFRTNNTNSTFHNLTIKRIPSQVFIPNIPKSFMAFSSEVFFGYDTNYQDNIYLPNNMGYYYGVPVMKDTQDGTLTFEQLFTDKRQPLQVADIADVLFGVNATIVVPLNDYNYSKLLPQHKKIYKSFGNVILNPNYVNEYFVEYNESITTATNSARFAIATWLFIYKEFKNQNSVPVYLLQGFHASLIKPTNNISTEPAMVKIRFIEYEESNKPLVPEEIRFHSNSYSTTFDFLFRDTKESLDTIGVLFCFALIGTIWCWYMCFFYIED